MNKLDHAIDELKNGNYSKGKTILLELLISDPNNTVILYNLGMCYSEMGMFIKSIEVLEKCIVLDSENANTLVALGFSYFKNNLNDKAICTLSRAIEIEPNNFYALKNLGGVYGKTGDFDNSIIYLERANAISSNVPEVLVTLAHAYEEKGNFTKANEIYNSINKGTTPYKLRKLAEEGLTRIAIIELKSRGYRYDVVMYCLSAIEMFSKMSKVKIKEISFEIAILGMSGFSINDVEKRYTLKSIKGDFSGLQLTCYMFVGFKLIDENLPPVADFETEYTAALNLFEINSNE